MDWMDVETIIKGLVCLFILALVIVLVSKRVIDQYFRVKAKWAYVDHKIKEHLKGEEVNDGV